MKKLLLGVSIILGVSPVLAYKTQGYNNDGRAYGRCNNGESFVASPADSQGVYHSLGPNGTQYSLNSRDEAIRKACGE